MDKRSVIFCRLPAWVRDRSGIQSQIPAEAASWIYETSSLTRRLKKNCGIDFRVGLLNQGWARPWPDEAQVLGMKPQRYALVREVQLFCSRRALIIARTVIPLDTLKGAQRRLSSLGTRPLGEVIFTYPALLRHRLDLTQVQLSDWNPEIRETLAIESSIWGRRTVYGIAGRKLLVCEFFLPAVLGSYSQRPSKFAPLMPSTAERSLDQVIEKPNFEVLKVSIK
ncbi:MAG: chorismate--pyruvate lyase family protein [Gammaproteobacteria bacterium]